MSNEITGTIIVIEATVQISETFTKREFVLQIENEYNPEKPQLIKFELVQDKCDLLNNFQVGMVVKVGYNLEGRKWTSPQGQDKYFNTLKAWRIDQEQNQMGQAPAPYQQPATPQIAAPAPNLQETIDDLQVPF